MSSAGFSKARLSRLRNVMAGYVERGEVPGLVALVSRRGEAYVEALGVKALGGSDPVQRDTIFRIASMTKPITAAAAMILVEECKLRLDDPVDGFLPELADRRVLKRLEGPLADTEPAKRPIALRDLLTFPWGSASSWRCPALIRSKPPSTTCCSARGCLNHLYRRRPTSGFGASAPCR